MKWCANCFVPFLVINPQADPNPGARDKEEYIEVVGDMFFLAVFIICLRYVTIDPCRAGRRNAGLAWQRVQV